MIKHKILLPDGTTLTSGTGTVNAIRSVQLTEQVNDETDLYPGAACASCAQIELWAPENGLAITQSDSLTLFRTDSATGQEEPVGIFLAEKPVKSSANVYKITAYDRMILLDKDLSPWLRDQQSAFPMALSDFITAVCGQCGVTLAADALTGLPNASYQIQTFYADSLTGRQLIQWAAQAAGRFARMTPAGELTFGWFASQGLTLTPQQYLQGSLQYEDYETAAIDKVQIRQSDSDVGVIYPSDAAGDNALVIQGNLLLTAENAEQIRPVSQSVYPLLQGIRYTPLSVSLYVGAAVPAPGTIVTVLDAHNRQLTTCVMQRSISGQKVSLTSTGNPRRDSTAAVNRSRLENLNGKMLEIQADIGQLSIKASELSGDYTELKQTMDEFSLTVVTDGNIRSKFAADATSITIESGVITFASNSLVVESDNFRLDSQGNVTITGSFYSHASNGNRMSLADGLAAFYARDSAGKSYLTTLISRTAEANPCGVVDVYGRSNTGTVNTQVRLQGGLTDGSIHLYSAWGTEQAVITSGEGNVSWLAGGLDVRGTHGVQANYGSIGKLRVDEMSVNGGAMQTVYWKWDGNLGAYVLSTSP